MYFGLIFSYSTYFFLNHTRISLKLLNDRNSGYFLQDIFKVNFNYNHNLGSFFPQIKTRLKLIKKGEKYLRIHTIVVQYSNKKQEMR